MKNKVLESHNDDHVENLTIKGRKNNKGTVIKASLDQDQSLEKINSLNVMKWGTLDLKFSYFS